MEKNMNIEELSELDNLVEENLTNLEIENIINLLSKLEINEPNTIEEIVHENKDFDINDILSDGITLQDICEQVLELAKKGLTPS
ncbi:hypothetical protein F8M41_000675 [Gigaspora margarita]|uniref:Uncharacterized protein n=1 Tax=Gigaspora margarita TaxID=4874 RepID=A0A8H4A8F0_GIGMA|nr:hypothetical protein F8M41_000675 [Gigaspora margarita]